jgi:choline monooxygenase
MTAQLPDFSSTDLVCEPIERAQTIPASWYTTPAFFNFERDKLFPNEWLYVGHVSQLPHAGDHIVETAAGQPIIVVRNAHGELRAFYNVCRHRAGPLATHNGCGARMLMCQYHGWTYTLNGQLRGVPHWDRVDLFDKQDYGLLPVNLAVWEGLLFVCLAESPQRSIETITADIRERIAPVTLADKRFFKRISYSIACNWKTYIDNYLEGYHVPIVHPELNKLYDYAQVTSHLHNHYSLQYYPLSEQAINGNYGVAASSAYYYCLFPNLLINIVGNRMQTNLIQPIDVGHCLVHFDYFYDDVESPEALRSIAADMHTADLVQHEDAEICEHVQRGLASNAYRTGRFSVQREECVYHFQCLLKQTLVARAG